MKKLLLITLALLSNFVNAQTLTKYVNNTQSNGRGFAYNITLRLTLLRMAADGTPNKAYNGTEYSVELIKVEVDKNKGWYQNGKVYSCSQLDGICNTKTFSSINLQLTYNCQGKELETNSATFYNIGDKQTMDLQPKSVGGASCKSPTVSGIGWVSVNDNETASIISSKIEQLNKGTAPIGQGENKSNPVANQTNTTITSNQSENTTDKPLDNYDPNTGLYTNPMANSTNSGSSTVDSYNKGYQQGQQIADIATGLADLFSPSPEKLLRRANEEAKKEKEKSDIKKYFLTESEKYLRKANNGNEHARMVLVGAHSYYLGYGHDFTSMLPDVDKWIQSAAANKNLDAMCFMGRYLLATDAYLQSNTPFGLKSKTDFYKILEEAATLGSVDAMEFLAYYYGAKKKYRGGENAEKALYWLNMAAEKGSPSAMFKMGNIFLYNHAGSKISSVKYKVNRDDSVAHNWFLKSVSNPNFKESLFQVADKRGASSNTRAYYELGMMYRSGKGCKKDLELAKKLFDAEYKSYRHLTPFSNDMIN